MSDRVTSIKGEMTTKNIYSHYLPSMLIVNRRKREESSSDNMNHGFFQLLSVQSHPFFQAIVIHFLLFYPR